MPEHRKNVTGEVTHIFAHRFVVQGADNAVLCDLTPRGSERVQLKIGDHVSLEGEMKPSELKVERLSRNGGKALEFDQTQAKAQHHPAAEPRIALQAAKEAGYVTLGALRRKPRHFEILARRDGELVELHVELDGRIRKVKSDFDRDKWKDAVAAG
jgi:hypothetical protein